MNPHFYRVKLKWNSDRKGIICSPELTHKTSESECIEVATPPDFPKGIAGMWSPEHLFTASVVSCFMTTFLAIAENSKLNFSKFECLATGNLEYVNGKPLMTAVILEPTLTIAEEDDVKKATRILEKTELSCLISNSIKSRVVMHPAVQIQKESVRL